MPVHVGLVYVETDYLESGLTNTSADRGDDSQPDQFQLSFVGGAPNTLLTQIIVDTDKDQDGLSVGDAVFDTLVGGRGKAGAHGFQVIDFVTADPSAQVTAEVIDGSMQLILRFERFQAGDKLIFSVDVDEVLRLSDDLAIFNSRLDVIKSGQEFQDSILTASFEAPHYYDVTGQGVFENDYGDPQQRFGVDLPPDSGDDPLSRPDRTAAALYSFAQSPLPISISGTVFLDNDLDLEQDGNENGIEDVALSLFLMEESTGRYEFTGHTTRTDGLGNYEFGTELLLFPGTYRVVETQPAGLFSVGAIPGTVAGSPAGQAATDDVLADIEIPLGDLDAIDYDFAEAEPARLSGFVYRDDSDDGFFDATEIGLDNVGVRLIPMDTIAPQSILETTTAADGSYSFMDLAPGVYRIIESAVPYDYTDGLDTAGTVDGSPVGQAVNPGDQINDVKLLGGSSGIEYNFGELPLGSISGFVFLANPGEDCTSSHVNASQPLADVRVVLEDDQGQLIAEAHTDVNGFYRFDGIAKGQYRIIETTPQGLLDGSAHVGSIMGEEVGIPDGSSRIIELRLPAGGLGTHYDFCEQALASISGHVYHDQSNDGVFDQAEDAITGARVDLLDASGTIVATRTTDAAGHYVFADLIPGTYTLRETTPADFIDGLDTAGTVDGRGTGQTSNPGDQISSIVLRQGQTGVEYNFGELVPGIISGRVHVETDGDCIVDPGEQLLSGVLIELQDDAGNTVAETVTDSTGTYAFSGLAPGSYTVIETQPDGFYQGGQRAGTAGGDASLANRISQIILHSGQHATDNDFCELPPGLISGFVHVDPDRDCVIDDNEQRLQGVVIQLLDDSGRQVQQTVTDADGRYEFRDLAPGNYTVVEQQPDGYYDGGQVAGTTGGDDSVANQLSGILLAGGQHSAFNNFCELPPGTISGFVHVDTDGDCEIDGDEERLGGVTIDLLNAAGDRIDGTVTDANGFYEFRDLAPGTYSVSQRQPAGFFAGSQSPGTTGGDAGDTNRISAIPLAAAEVSSQNNFCETPPAVISGYVFQDGPPRLLLEIPAAEDLRLYSDGLRTADDTPLPGVILELRDVLGNLYLAENALPGTYPDGPIRTVSDETGFYQFTGLREGSYHVYEIHPEAFVDGLDTPGTTGGFAVNPADALTSSEEIQLQSLSFNRETDPGTDGIILIDLPAGGRSVENNFSEILVDPTLPPPKGFERPIANRPLQIPEAFPDPPLLIQFPDAVEIVEPIWSDLEIGLTWHLSIIDGGFPRGQIAKVSDGGTVIQNAAIVLDTAGWTTNPRNRGNWILMDRQGNLMPASSQIDLGDEDAVPLAGDFNGDGRDELALFIAGNWYIDINGNGHWDVDDLWVRLGTEMDRPVIGDWDGDGKDDIGIFGPQWLRDPEAIAHDPGLPDPDNQRRSRPKNTPPTEPEATDGTRLMRLKHQGELRSDLIDHVFRYGRNADVPVAGDWNGDGIDAIAVFRAGRWMLDADGDGRWTTRDRTVEFGESGDTPIVGDWNGDGIDDLGVVRGDVWIIDLDGNRKLTPADPRFVQPNSPNASPVAGDWDGDGADEAGSYHVKQTDDAEKKSA